VYFEGVIMLSSNTNIETDELVDQIVNGNSLKEIVCFGYCFTPWWKN